MERNMDTRINRAIEFAIFAFFVSTSLSAAPIIIGAESGALRSLDGAWGIGCESGGPGLPDENEVLVFEGDTVAGKLITYTSTDGTCSSGGVITTEAAGTVVAVEDFVTLGWLGEFGNPVLPPLRLDGTGSLNPNPTVTKLEFFIPGAPTERTFFYMDDTAEPWCLYRDAGTDTTYSDYVSTFERRCMVDVPPVTPECDIQLNQTSFGNGDTVTANVYRFANLTTAPIATEMKFWLGVPGIPPISVANVGSDGSIELPAGLDSDFGPIPLIPVTAALPRGTYEFSCRFLDPVTGELLAEDRNFFEIVYSVGDIGPAGGIVFYVTDGGRHGLEAAPVDQGDPGGFAAWGCHGIGLGANRTAIGTGAQNTADILARCAEPGIAAEYVDAYSLNGFDDWFLPSKDELNELYLNRSVVGSFDVHDYWSSSEGIVFNAWGQNLVSGSQNVNSKDYRGRVRAIRAF
jgi:hypothetical protein